MSPLTILRMDLRSVSCSHYRDIHEDIECVTITYLIGAHKYFSVIKLMAVST